MHGPYAKPIPATPNSPDIVGTDGRSPYPSPDHRESRDRKRPLRHPRGLRVPWSRCWCQDRDGDERQIRFPPGRGLDDRIRWIAAHRDPESLSDDRRRHFQLPQLIQQRQRRLGPCGPVAGLRIGHDRAISHAASTADGSTTPTRPVKWKMPNNSSGLRRA